MKKSFLKRVSILVVSCILITGNAMDVFAASKSEVVSMATTSFPSNWYTNYSYKLVTEDGANLIKLKKYQGNESDVYIPGYAVINGTRYTTCLEHKSYASYSLFSEKKENIKNIVIGKDVRIDDPAYLFYHLSNLESIKFEKVDSSRCTELGSMFSGNDKLKTIDMSQFDFTNVENVSHMCSRLTALEKIDFGTQKASKIKDCSWMFDECRSLKEVDLSNISNSVIENMTRMFGFCYALKKVNLTGFDNTVNLNAITNMFYYCDVLEYVDMSTLDLSKISSDYKRKLLFATPNLVYLRTPKKTVTEFLIEPELRIVENGKIPTAKRKSIPSNLNQSILMVNTTEFEHVFSYDVISETKSTCTQMGEETRWCYWHNKVCEREMPLLSHTYVKTVIPPTETSMGYTHKVCSGCGKVEDFDYVPVLTPGKKHTWNYSASGATLTATCDKKCSEATTHKLKLTISASDKDYTGKPYNGASLGDTSAWKKAGLTVPTIKYIGRDKTSYKLSSTAPTAVGKYTASIAVDGKKASVSFEIKKKDVEVEQKAATLSLDEKFKVTTGKNIKVAWGSVKGADGYDVYMAYCGKDKLTLVKSVKASVKTVTVTKLKKKAIDQKKHIKCYVVAYKKVNGKKVTLAKTFTAHAVGKKNTSVTDAKDITLAKKSITIKKGKTETIKAKTVKVNKKLTVLDHVVEFRYDTSDKSIATVSSKGKITAKKKGTCYVYVYAVNGMAKKIEVKVK